MSWRGSMMPIYHAIDGRSVYPDSASLPQPPDVAVIATPETVPSLIGTLGDRGTRAAVVITAGFGELGESGRRLASMRASRISHRSRAPSPF
jgi:acetyltransferase